MELRPDDSLLWGIAWSHVLEGRLDDAATVAARLTEERFRLGAPALLEFARGHRAEAKVALDALIAKFGSSDPVWIAEYYAWRGDLDSAFAWLDRAYAARDTGLLNLKLERSLKSLRGDPRYTALLKKMNLPLD